MSSDSKPAAFSNSNEPPPVAHAASESESGNGAGYASYPKLDPKDVAPVANTWSSTQSGSPPAPTSVEYIGATAVPSASNPYVSAASAPSSSLKNNMDKVRDALGKWGKKAADATKRAEDLAGNMWQHLKTGPSVADAAVGKIAQSTKVLAEGGYEKVFQNTFEIGADEKLLKSYGCYLSTSAGPIVGVLYLSNEKVAFCSDSPISYKASEEVQYRYYKVIIPLNQLTAVNPSVSRANPSEKYIQIISVDNHEFWFMGFVNYDSAVKNLQDAVRTRPI